MAQFHNILKADRVSTWKSRYAQGDGDDMQDWFVKVEGVEEPVKTTTKITSPEPSGQTYCTLEKFMSQKSGKPYFKLKREQTPDGMEKPAETVHRTSTPTDGLAAKVAQLEQRVAKLEGGAQQDVVIDDDMVDEPVNMSDIPF